MGKFDVRNSKFESNSKFKVRKYAGVLFCAVIFLRVGLAHGAPAAGPTDAQLESTPIGGEAAGGGNASVGGGVGGSGFEVERVVAALGAVIALIFLMRAVVRRVAPGTGGARASGTVKVIARTGIGPKQNLIVVQFGKRLILVGESGGNLNPLCEVSEPDEVAGIVAGAREQTISVARRFESLFGRERKQYSADEPESETFDPSNEVAAPSPLIEQTQNELAGLREKVREVARQIGSA